MPRANSIIMGNLFLKNLEKIILIYVYKGGDDQALNELMNVIRDFCSNLIFSFNLVWYFNLDGALYLALIVEEGSDEPSNVQTSIAKKYEQFTATLVNNNYVLSGEEAQRLGYFINFDGSYFTPYNDNEQRSNLDNNTVIDPHYYSPDKKFDLNNDYKNEYNADNKVPY